MQAAQHGKLGGVVEIVSAADRLDALHQVGRWYWEEWGHADPDGSVESWTTALLGRANRDEIPMTLLAYEDGQLAGSVCLVEHDMPDREDLAELSPWVAGTYVEPGSRHRGIGSALMRQAVAAIEKTRNRHLYLYTSSATGFYERLGWQRLRDAVYEGQAVAIMRYELGTIAAVLP